MGRESCGWKVIGECIAFDPPFNCPVVGRGGRGGHGDNNLTLTPTLVLILKAQLEYEKPFNSN